MNESILTVLISIVGSFVISLFVAKYYCERWVETRRSRIEHSNKLKDRFFKPWLEKISEYKTEYCEIDAKYSIENGKIVPLKPTDPDDLEFFAEASNHLEDYEKLLKDWENLKQETLKLNEELAVLFEEIRVLILKEINIPYWCPRYSGDMFDAIYAHYDIRKAKCSVEDEPSDFNVQISASEEPIDFQVAVDQPIEIETEST